MHGSDVWALASTSDVATLAALPRLQALRNEAGAKNHLSAHQGQPRELLFTRRFSEKMRARLSLPLESSISCQLSYCANHVRLQQPESGWLARVLESVPLDGKTSKHRGFEALAPSDGVSEVGLKGKKAPSAQEVDVLFRKFNHFYQYLV